MAKSYTDRPRKPQTGAGRPGLPTSPQGVGKGPKIVDLSKLDFPYEPTAVLCREFKGGFRPIYRIEQRPSDPRVATGGPRRPARGEARPGARCRGDGVGRLRDLGAFYGIGLDRNGFTWTQKPVN